mmetsp:Transcript_32742/g.48487  ORF Transcript_32742/g.48487 Transcript_32742/m.48487 type:complete len:104 (+) Transcript_32742:1-312(+)
MGCCCCKRSATFAGEGYRLGSADEQRADREAAAKNRYRDQPERCFTDAALTDEERAQIREERLAAAEGRLTKQQKKEMKQKKKPTSGEPLCGPNSQNTMRWTS